MKKIIFLVGEYMPKASANGICTHAIAKALIDMGENVSVVCYEDGFTDTSFEGVSIRRVEVPLYIKDDLLINPIQRRLRRIDSLSRKLFYLPYYPLRSKSLVNQYVKAAIKELNADAFCECTIVSVVNPIETALAGAELKKLLGTKCTTVFYSADTLSNEMGNEALLSNDYRAKKGFKWEIKLFSVFDKIMIMEPQREHYFSDQFSEFKNKMALANFPLLKPNNNVAITKNNNEKCLLVYAGTIYKKLRNPSYLLVLLSELTAACDCEVVFLGRCNCKELFEKAESDSNGKIKYIGMQPYDVAQEYLRKASVLLSIGNKESHMAPSKIYEYMSSGKPIIHTYTDDDDMCVPALEHYGNALILKEDCINQGIIRNVIEFVKNRNEIDYKTIKKRFLTATPDYSAKIILGEN